MCLFYILVQYLYHAITKTAHHFYSIENKTQIYNSSLDNRTISDNSYEISVHQIVKNESNTILD